MASILAFILLILLGGTTLYVFITRVILPIYKIYKDEMQIK